MHHLAAKDAETAKEARPRFIVLSIANEKELVTAASSFSLARLIGGE